jgi:ABC-type transporter Mla subunit MlaD
MDINTWVTLGVGVAGFAFTWYRTTHDDIKNALQELKSELKGDIQELRSELKGDIRLLNHKVEALNDRTIRIEENLNALVKITEKDAKHRINA